MDIKIIISQNADDDLEQIINYLKTNWQQSVLDNFIFSLKNKYTLLKQNPRLGFKPTQYSKYRRTVISSHYILIYTYSKKIITIHRIKHSSQKT